MAFSKISEMQLRTTGRSKGIAVFGGFSAPTNFVASDAVVDQINFSWTAPASVPGQPPVTGYRIDISGPISETILTNSTNTSYTWTGGTRGVTYTFAIAAINSGGVGQFSVPVSQSPKGFTANGGTTQTLPSGEIIHTFTSSGTFNVTTGGTAIRYMVVGGGKPGGTGTLNSGGGIGGNGGNGGQVIHRTADIVNANSYAVTVGGSNQDSSFNNYVAVSGNGAAGGTGGFGAGGSNGTSNDISTVSTIYGSGGGSGGHTDFNFGGAGGSGAGTGGRGGSPDTCGCNPTAGLANRGGGGGGGGGNKCCCSCAGAAGGSGIVIIRYTP
jgi:hypothetical protein